MLKSLCHNGSIWIPGVQLRQRRETLLQWQSTNVRYSQQTWGLDHLPLHHWITGLSLIHNFIAKKCVACLPWKYLRNVLETTFAKCWSSWYLFSYVQFTLYEVNVFLSCIFHRTFENRTKYAMISHSYTHIHVVRTNTTCCKKKKKSRDTDWLDTYCWRIGNEIGCISDWKVPFQENRCYSKRKHC